jgi:signal transduction histidine kinase
MTAREEEQRRAARELHHGLAQQLAALEMDIHQLREGPLDDTAKTAFKLAELQSRISSISNEVRELSHRLYPSILEDLGLAAALRNLVDDFQQRHDLHVHLQIEEIPAPIPLPVATALYRIAQEALRNVVQHAGEEALVTLLVSHALGTLRLIIHDTGRGFDPKTIRVNGGLGILSMQERARQVGGSVEIETSYGQGTTVTLMAPR